jgi:translation elongation factor EF-G
MLSEYKVNANVGAPRVSYRETIKSEATIDKNLLNKPEVEANMLE